MSTERARRPRNATKIIPIHSHWGACLEAVYEIPLIELIIRKKMGLSNKENLVKTPGQYYYKPSQSYFNFVSKFYPSRKKR